MDAVTAMADALLVSGLSAFSFSAAAVAAAIALSEDADAAMTAVHGLSFFCYSVADAATETDAAESSNICVRNVCSKVHNQKGMQYLHPFLHIKCYPSFVAFSFWI